MGDRLTANGQFAVRQSDYGIKPVSVAGGTLKLKDEIELVVRHRGARAQPGGLRRRVMCLAIPGQIVEFHAAGTDLAMVDVSGVRRRVEHRPARQDDRRAATGC